MKNSEYFEVYKYVFKNLPVISAVLLLIGTIIFTIANSVMAITDTHFLVILVMGIFISLTSYALLTIIISAAVVRTDAVLDIKDAISKTEEEK